MRNFGCLRVATMVLIVSAVSLGGFTVLGEEPDTPRSNSDSTDRLQKHQVEALRRMGVSRLPSPSGNFEIYLDSFPDFKSSLFELFSIAGVDDYLYTKYWPKRYRRSPFHLKLEYLFLQEEYETSLNSVLWALIKARENKGQMKLILSRFKQLSTIVDQFDEIDFAKLYPDEQGHRKEIAKEAFHNFIYFCVNVPSAEDSAWRLALKNALDRDQDKSDSEWFDRLAELYKEGRSVYEVKYNADQGITANSIVDSWKWADPLGFDFRKRRGEYFFFFQNHFDSILRAGMATRRENNPKAVEKVARAYFRLLVDELYEVSHSKRATHEGALENAGEEEKTGRLYGIVAKLNWLVQEKYFIPRGLSDLKVLFKLEDSARKFRERFGTALLVDEGNGYSRRPVSWLLKLDEVLPSYIKIAHPSLTAIEMVEFFKVEVLPQMSNVDTFLRFVPQVNFYRGGQTRADLFIKKLAESDADFIRDFLREANRTLTSNEKWILRQTAKKDGGFLSGARRIFTFDGGNGDLLPSFRPRCASIADPGGLVD